MLEISSYRGTRRTAGVHDYVISVYMIRKGKLKLWSIIVYIHGVYLANRN